MESRSPILFLTAASIAMALFVVATLVLSRSAQTPQQILIFLIVLLATGFACSLFLVRSSSSQRKYRGLISSMDDVILILDADGKYVEVVPTNPELLYKPLASMEGLRMHDVLPKDDADRFLSHVHRVLEARCMHRIEYSLPIGERLIWFEAEVSPLSSREVIWVARDITARREAEQELQRAHVRLKDVVRARTQELHDSEERFRTTFDQANDIIFSTRLDGVITSFNTAFERILGYDREGWAERSFDELLPQDDRVVFQRLVERHGKAATLIVLHADGTPVMLELTIIEHVLNDETSGYLAVARDVTARERAAADLRRSEQQLSEAQQIARVGSWDADLLTGESWWSLEMYRILELDPERDGANNQEFLSLIVPDDLEHHRSARGSVGSGKTIEWEVRVELRSGTRKTLHLHARIISRDGNQRVLGTVQDVTEKRASEQRLRESEARFQLLGRATNDVIWDWDCKMDRLAWGEGMQRQFGFAPEELTDRLSSWSDRVHPDDHDRVSEHFRQVLRSGEVVYSDEYRFLTARGTYASVLDRGFIVRDENGQAVRVVGAMTDFTERKQLEEQLAQTKRVSSLGRVAASMAHEFNNVLMGIQPNVEAIGRQSPENLAPIVDNVLIAVGRGRRITDAILTYTRSSEPSRECVDMETFLRSWSAETKPALGPHIDLQLSFGPGALYVSADRMQIGQVMANLAMNARDAMEPRGGALAISVHEAKRSDFHHVGLGKDHDRFIHIRVSDNGCGIQTDHLELISEPFFTTKRSGTGLGLAITYQIVQSHDGHIFVESRAGEGTTFDIFLPKAVPATEPERTDAHLRPTALSRVLLVEDEEVVAAGIKALLDLEGIGVHHVRFGEEVIAAMELFDPDAVILDYALPDISGAEVFERISSSHPTLPVIFSSGHADESILADYVSRRHVAFLQKPYGAELLMECLTEVFASTEPRAPHIRAGR